MLGFWSSTDSWFSGLNTFLKGYADSAAAPFKNGVATGIDAMFTTVWAGMKANPYATAATVVVGGVTLYAYKNNGFGESLGKLHVGFNNFLAHATVKVGLGKEPVTNYWEINSRLNGIDNTLRRLEEGQTELANNERTRSEAHRTRTNEVKGMITDFREFVGQRFTTLFDSMKAQNKATSDRLAALEAGSAEALRLLEAAGAAARPKPQ